MHRVSYTVAPFKFNNQIRYAFQYRVKHYTDNAVLHAFLRQFKGKSGLYCFHTNEGTKVGISKNLPRRLKEHITPALRIDSLSFVVFNLFPYQELARVEDKVKQHYKAFLVEGSSEFFKGQKSFDVFNTAKSYFFKLTSKNRRYKGPKVEFKHHSFTPQPKYTSTSLEVSEYLDDFYS